MRSLHALCYAQQQARPCLFANNGTWLVRRISLMSLSLSFCCSCGSSSHVAWLVSVFCCFLALILRLSCSGYSVFAYSSLAVYLVADMFVVAGKHTFATRMGQTAGHRLLTYANFLSRALVSRQHQCTRSHETQVHQTLLLCTRTISCKLARFRVTA